MHNTYIVPNLVDGDVAHAQAFKRAQDARILDTTIVHNHRAGFKCTDETECIIYEPGYRPYPLGKIEEREVYNETS